MRAATRQRVVIVRHGETEWSREQRHTGRIDLPLTENGLRQAEALRAPLARWTFAAVFTSPLSRARQTCELAGFPDAAVLDDLVEWDYGAYEGMTADEVRAERPDWLLWRDGVPDGETLDQVAARARHVLAGVRGINGDVLLVAHGHLLRVLTACWLELHPSAGQRFFLGTATPSELGYEHSWTVIRQWNVAGQS
jgi:broad specificity phosphatase PhoE